MSHCIDMFALYSSLVFSSVCCLSLLEMVVFFCLCFAGSSILLLHLDPDFYLHCLLGMLTR